MLRFLPQNVRDCHARAAECREKAEAIADTMLKAHFLEMEERWLYLARSYEFVDSLQHFMLHIRKGPPSDIRKSDRNA